MGGSTTIGINLAGTTTVSNNLPLAIGTFSDKDLNFTTGTAAPGDNAQVTFALRKLKINADTTTTVLDNNVASVTKKVTVINPSNELIALIVSRICLQQLTRALILVKM